MRKTKIVATIGPASDNEETFTALCRAGLDVARLNFSHGTHEEHKKKFDLIRSVRSKLCMPIAIMLDTKGPEYRIKTFENKKVTIQEGQQFIFTTEDVIGNEERVSVNYSHLTEELSVGDRVLVNNGLVIFEVTAVNGSEAVTRCISGGVLSDRKSMNFPNKVMRHEYLSEQDKSDILFGIEQGIEYVAASFVSTKDDVLALRIFLDENGGKDIDIIAKIENRSGVDHIDEICEIADGIMIARGDLGVEIPAVEVPPIQKMLITKCRMLGTRVITATEMLESMIEKPRPTRAEVSDVANAVYDGTSAVMLSGETASGKYPVEALRTMALTVETTEATIHYEKRFKSLDVELRNNQDAVSHTTCSMAIDVGAKCIIVNSLSGKTARLVSRFRCPVDIIGMTTSEKVWRKLNLSWGVTPMLCGIYDSMESMFANAVREVTRVLDLQPGDNVVLTGGMMNGRSGNTNIIKLEQIEG
ncbi:MAG: pyruvate kinase [Eubacterium sp.]|nr:pyruvate kinase [Eubacterium sp.]